MGYEYPAYWHALVLNMRSIIYVSALAHTFHMNIKKGAKCMIYSVGFLSYCKGRKVIHG
jgi:hypothetical protein